MAESFEHLYFRWWSDVVALCRRVLGRSEDAEDMAQEAFVRAWLARDQYTSSRPFWPWVATIARRLCLDQRRRSGYELVDDEADDLETVEVTPERAVLATEELRLVAEAVNALRSAERHTLVRHEVDGWSYERIAAARGVTVESVRGSLKRARASLRRSVLHDAVFGQVLTRPTETTERRVQAGSRSA